MEEQIETIKEAIKNKQYDILTNSEYINDALLIASKNGHLDIVKYLIKNGADIHTEDDFALILAKEFGYLNVVEYLIENGANVNANNNQAFNFRYLKVVKNNANINDNEILQDIIDIDADIYINNDTFEYQLDVVENGANINIMEDPRKIIGEAIKNKQYDILTNIKYIKGALRYAIFEGHLDIVKYLIEEAGVDIHDTDEILFMTFTNCHYDIFNYLVKMGADIHDNDNEALQSAIEDGNLEIVKYLIEAGANIHANDILINAIMTEESEHHLDIVKYLIEVGADVHTDDDYALKWASECGHLKIVKILIKTGANIHANDDKALQEATYNNHLNIVKILIKAGANIHANDDKALQYAVLNERLDIIKYLVKIGANIHANNDYALQFAADFSNLDIIKYLVSAANFHNWDKKIIQDVIETNNIKKEIKKYLIHLPIKILYMRINASNKIQKWFRQYLIKKYNPNSNHVKNDIKPRFESMQIKN